MDRTIKKPSSKMQSGAYRLTTPAHARGGAESGAASLRAMALLSLSLSDLSIGDEILITRLQSLS